MLVISGRNVNDVYHECLWNMHLYGVVENSRNGTALVVPTPVCSVYTHPLERMLFNAKRDANPFFHIIEGLWMLAGKNEHGLIAPYAAHIATFSDDGATLNGAYGHRWRTHFEIDQLTWVIDHLKFDPASRRAVLGMWDPMEDPVAVDNGSKDVPCNTHVYFRANDGALDMTVCCRSNDAIWGAYGANVVHMSMLQEYVANAVAVPVGKYYQFSNNFHVYEKHWGLMQPQAVDTYTTFESERHVALLDGSNSDSFYAETLEFFATPGGDFKSKFLRSVARPIQSAWKLHKSGDTQAAIAHTAQIADPAVSRACKQWLTRRLK